ncbi:hypothetical protein CXG81DRAFT_18973 [Caulochytrium protostelioides]|uniref:WSC domain-containing protein n=1 Tax=Caulochytrium protostelioides TaxID=1555241 RepID=A0A4P9X808_9FUNG|nr:hypothetical protein CAUPRSCDRAFT_10928 [Caulochytrium protostelioides]RKP01200.1 hypothetical protein CXG81DRAFT_18973 [Caulochytrium protostelioides]|eukprot:RKP01200.1 hypothetical protein CXG81DRAFT_18973 [Caulochytrium protostelioides]
MASRRWPRANGGPSYAGTAARGRSPASWLLGLVALSLALLLLGPTAAQAWSLQGCYSPNAPSAIPSQSMITNISANACAAQCTSQGAAYALVKSPECACIMQWYFTGNFTVQNGAECDVSCATDGLPCGSPTHGRWSVYLTGVGLAANATGNIVPDLSDSSTNGTRTRNNTTDTDPNSVNNKDGNGVTNRISNGSLSSGTRAWIIVVSVFGALGLFAIVFFTLRHYRRRQNKHTLPRLAAKKQPWYRRAGPLAALAARQRRRANAAGQHPAAARKGDGLHPGLSQAALLSGGRSSSTAGGPRLSSTLSLGSDPSLRPSLSMSTTAHHPYAFALPSGSGGTPLPALAGGLGAPPSAASAHDGDAAMDDLVPGLLPRTPNMIYSVVTPHSVTHDPHGDMLRLREDDVVHVQSVYADGWAFGTSVTSGESGMFPLATLVGDDRYSGKNMVVPARHDSLPPPESASPVPAPSAS